MPKPAACERWPHKQATSHMTAPWLPLGCRQRSHTPEVAAHSDHPQVKAGQLHLTAIQRTMALTRAKASRWHGSV